MCPFQALVDGSNNATNTAISTSIPPATPPWRLPRLPVSSLIAVALAFMTLAAMDVIHFISAKKESFILTGNLNVSTRLIFLVGTTVCPGFLLSVKMIRDSMERLSMPTLTVYMIHT